MTGFVMELVEGNDLSQRSRSHNNYEAELWFGAREDNLVREQRAGFMDSEILDDRAAIRTLRSGLAELGLGRV